MVYLLNVNKCKLMRFCYGAIFRRLLDISAIEMLFLSTVIF